MVEEKKTKKQEKKGNGKDSSEKPKLQDLPGVGPAAVEKLENAGIFDLMGIAVLGAKELSEISGLSEAVSRKVIQASRKMMDLGFQDGLEYAEVKSNAYNITTGSKEFDGLLGGKGIETRGITESFGSYGSGKCVSKDTNVCYFNDERMHVEQIEETYDKYKDRGKEERFEEGFVVPVNTVKVLGWVNGNYKIVDAKYLYREKVKKLFCIKTKRGRKIKVTGNHKLLRFSGGVGWKKTRNLREGDLIACPNQIELETEKCYDEDDAYFLGMFVAEGTSNPFSISTGSERTKNWICSYIKNKFNYLPTVRIDNRRENPCYTILFRLDSRNFMKGLDKCNSSNKFIPEGIFLSNKNVISSFLGGYFDGDAEVSKGSISVTTKSKKLSNQLTYLLLRLGIATSLRERVTNKKKCYVVSIVGGDREKAKEILFKEKSFNIKIRNSAYGYPNKISSFISDIYRVCLEGNRGRLRKEVGKRNIEGYVYSNLLNNVNAKSINEKTLNKIEEIFENQKKVLVNTLTELEDCRLDINILRKVFPKLPFAFNSLSDKLGVKKGSVENYYYRKLPKSKSELLKNLIVNELKTRIDLIYLALEIISEIRLFNWDVIESIEKIDYEDYVYDFVVPEGHSFVGGNMPTMMHNTQLGLSLAVNVQLPLEKGGAEGKAVYIDTEGTFKPQRVREIAREKGLDEEGVLKNIMVARAFNSLPGKEKVYILNEKGFYKESIENVVNNRKDNKVLTFAFDSEIGKMKPALVTNFISHYIQKGEPIYNIKTKFGREIRVSGSHSLFKGVRKGKRGEPTVKRQKFNMRPVVEEVDHLNVGDYIAIPRYLPMAEKNLSVIDLFTDIKQFPEKIRNEVKIVKEGIRLNHTGRRKSPIIPRHIKCDKDLLWLLGFIIAEGNSQYKNKLIRVRLSSETKYLKKAEKIIEEKFGLDAHLYEKFHELLVSSRLFSLILKYIFKIRVDKKSPYREMPGWIMQLPLDKLKFFIKGFWDGDGYHSESCRKNRLIFHTSSRDLSNDISMALLRFGILSSIFKVKLNSREDYKEFWNKHYRVEAAGLSSNDILNLGNAKQKLNAPIWNDLVFAKIKSINKELTKKETKVYDFEVNSSEAPFQNFLGGVGGVCCHNSDHQMLLVDKVGEMIQKGEPIRLVVIDSLTAHFRAEFSGRGQLADRQQKLNKYLHNLMKIAEQYNIAIYVTNQVMANPAMMFGDPTTAIGGNIVGHACLTEDSLIQLGDGSIKNIKDMAQDEIVSTDLDKMNLNKSGSDKVFINPDVKNKYEIKTSKQINCSPLHRFFTIENFGIIEKEARELKKGDFVLQARKLNIEGEKQELPFIENKKIARISKKQGNEVSKKLKENNISREEICNKIGITPRQFRRVLNQEYPTSTNVFKKMDNHFSRGLQLQTQICQTYKHRDLIMPQFMTSGLGQIFGYFIGDGNFEERGLRFRDERKEVLQVYKDLFKNVFNVSGRISKMKDKICYTLNINSQVIKNLFKEIIPSIYDYIGKSKDDVVKGFIKGFVDAEGYINKKNARIIISNKEKEILRHLQLFLLRFGINSTIKFKVGKKNMNVLRLNSREVLDYLKIGFTASDKQKELVKWKKYYKNTYVKEMMPIKKKELAGLLRDAGLKPYTIIKSRPEGYKWVNRKELKKAFKELMNQEIKDRQIKQKINFIFKVLNSDLYFEKIREINVEKNKGELFYDFSVPKNENYIANGFVVHNSTYRLYIRRGKKDSRVAKLIDSPNLPDGECIFYIGGKGVVDEK